MKTLLKTANLQPWAKKHNELLRRAEGQKSSFEDHTDEDLIHHLLEDKDADEIAFSAIGRYYGQKHHGNAMKKRQNRIRSQLQGRYGQ